MPQEFLPSGFHIPFFLTCKTIRYARDWFLSPSALETSRENGILFFCSYQGRRLGNTFPYSQSSIWSLPPMPCSLPTMAWGSPVTVPGPTCYDEDPLTQLLWEGLMGSAGRQDLNNLVKAVQGQGTEDIHTYIHNDCGFFCTFLLYFHTSILSLVCPSNPLEIGSL